MLPGSNEWEKLYVTFKNCQLQFLTNVKNHTFKYSYCCCELIVRTTSKYITTSDQKVNKIETLLVCHKYDSTPLYLTVPMFYEGTAVKGSSVSRILAAVKDKLIEMSAVVNPFADETNRHSWGKLKIHINQLRNFPFYGTVFVKFSLQPWQFKTKKIMDSKLEFGQTYFVPLANNWFTLKIEVINL